MSVHSYTDLDGHVGHHLECVRYGDGENVAVECTDCCEVLLDFDHPPEPVAADLSAYRGVFADGYTPEEIADVLDAISEKLGVSLHCLWEYVGEYGPAGDSDLLAVIDDEAREIPPGLDELLVEGTGDGVVDPATITDGPREEWVQGVTHSYESESTRNWAIEDRRTTRI